MSNQTVRKLQRWSVAGYLLAPNLSIPLKQPSGYSTIFNLEAFTIKIVRSKLTRGLGKFQSEPKRKAQALVRYVKFSRELFAGLSDSFEFASTAGVGSIHKVWRRNWRSQGGRMEYEPSGGPTHHFLGVLRLGLDYTFNGKVESSGVIPVSCKYLPTLSE